jgi:DNA-binding transcriptional regulator LsrR (DeoR family)
LDEAMRQGEVQVWIGGEGRAPVGLAVELEARFGLAEAIVAPAAAQPAEAVGAALGGLLSEALADGMVIGAGWGRVLKAALKHVEPQRREDMRVVSLMGGLVEFGAANPVEFAWRLAGLTGARCHLMLAPLIVDSPDTKLRLLENSGLGTVMELAGKLDIAVLSCGDPLHPGGSLAADRLAPELRAELAAGGAVADVMCHFLDAAGARVGHALSGRIMAADLELVARAKHVVLAAGGAARAPAIRAALKRFAGATLVTDEAAARALLAEG